MTTDGGLPTGSETVDRADWDWAIRKAEQVLPAHGELSLSQWLRMLRERLAASPPEAEKRPEIVCLCGSTRFKDAFLAEAASLTLGGAIVVGPELFGHAGDDLHGKKVALDELHLRKIDLADCVHVLNVGGYVGESTRREIAYAKAHGKPLSWLVDGPFPREGDSSGNGFPGEHDAGCPCEDGAEPEACRCVRPVGAPLEAEKGIRVFVSPYDLRVLREHKDEVPSYPLTVSARPQSVLDMAVMIVSAPPEASEEPQMDPDYYARGCAPVPPVEPEDQADLEWQQYRQQKAVLARALDDFRDAGKDGYSVVQELEAFLSVRPALPIVEPEGDER